MIFIIPVVLILSVIVLVIFFFRLKLSKKKPVILKVVTDKKTDDTSETKEKINYIIDSEKEEAIDYNSPKIDSDKDTIESETEEKIDHKSPENKPKVKEQEPTIFLDDKATKIKSPTKEKRTAKIEPKPEADDPNNEGYNEAYGYICTYLKNKKQVKTNLDLDSSYDHYLDEILQILTKEKDIDIFMDLHKGPWENREISDSKDLIFKIFHNFILYYKYKKYIVQIVTSIAQKYSDNDKIKWESYKKMEKLPGWRHVGENELLEHGELEMIQAMKENLLESLISKLINNYEMAKQKGWVLFFLCNIAVPVCVAGIYDQLQETELELEKDDLADWSLSQYNWFYMNQKVEGVINVGLAGYFDNLVARKLHSSVFDKMTDKYKKMKDGALWRRSPATPRHIYNDYLFTFVKEKIKKKLAQMAIEKTVSDDEIVSMLVKEEYIDKETYQKLPYQEFFDS